MKTIKEIIGIKSFSKTIGNKQPTETCPMIDNHISDLNYENKYYQSEIDELENDEEPDNIKIQEIEDKIYYNKDLIERLESSRKKIQECRYVGLANRDNFISILDNNLILHNNRYYLCTKELQKLKENLSYSDFDCLDIDYKDVVKNYDALIEWAISWDCAWECFENDINSSVIKLNLYREDFDELSQIMSNVELLLTEGISSEELLDSILNVFPDVEYKGIAYELNNKFFKNEKESSSSIEFRGIDVILLWENYFPYLDVPYIELIPVN